MKKEWIFENNNSDNKSLIERLLISRGIKTEQDIKDFLHPLEMELTSPNVFTDMQKTVERLSAAIENQESIVIYGDFDADGVTSTSVLYKTFKFLGANVHYFIPNREKEGHGFDKSALITLMTTVKPKVIISVDCGISDVDAVKFVNSFKNIDIIITDHHEAPEMLPPAFAIINPKAQNSLSEKLNTKQIEYLTYLAGCGVAFKVAQALLMHYNKTDFVYEILPFVAIGTIADVVPLLGENRYFVTKGLELISSGHHEGIKQLLESAGYDISKGITSEQIAFGIAPRINASGRLDTVDCSLKVLLSESSSEIQMAITTLNELNTVRQKLCQETFEQADKMVKKEGNKFPAIVLSNPEWHIGIIGIVASKLVEKYYKPVFLMTYSKETNEYRCSARSIEGVPLYDVIQSSADLLDGFGGHTMAAGLTFNAEKSDFETVKKSLCETVKEYTLNKKLEPFLKIDLLLRPEEVTLDLTEKLSVLEPFGASNPSPVFAMKDLVIKQKKLMGNDNSHLKLILSSGASEFTAIRWSKGDINLNPSDKIDIAFHPQINEFNGNTSVQLIIDDIQSDLLKEEDIYESKFKIYDNRMKTDILPEVNDYLKNTKYNIKVFAESKSVIDKIKPYKEIYSRIFSRTDIPKCDVVMFFDYPADKKTLDLILEKTNPKALHFMNYEPKVMEEEEFLKTFSGMIRFVCKNNDGKFELVRSASFLDKSVELIEQLLDLFEKLYFIKISEKNNLFYKIEFNKNIELAEILQHKNYQSIYEISEECELFQKSMLEDDLESLLNN